jgi:hypothetical protein
MNIAAKSAFKFLRLISLIITVSFMGACAVVNTVFVEDRKKPGPDANMAGIIGTSRPGGNLDDVRQTMIDNCADWGGLRTASVQQIPKSWKGGKMFTDYWQYNCNGLMQNPQQSPMLLSTPDVPKINNNQNLSIDQAKEKCNELGFKSGTEVFGNCVLKVTK